jgi:hypothetical protein
VGDALDEPEKALIAQRVRDVEQAVSDGGSQALQRANRALDEATQRLATLLVERAMQGGQK